MKNNYIELSEMKKIEVEIIIFWLDTDGESKLEARYEITLQKAI